MGHPGAVCSPDLEDVTGTKPRNRFRRGPPVPGRSTRERSQRSPYGQSNSHAAMLSSQPGDGAVPAAGRRARRPADRLHLQRISRLGPGSCHRGASLDRLATLSLARLHVRRSSHGPLAAAQRSPPFAPRTGHPDISTVRAGRRPHARRTPLENTLPAWYRPLRQIETRTRNRRVSHTCEPDSSTAPR